jgi:DNA-binding FrmR family transcriptional regulator
MGRRPQPISQPDRVEEPGDGRATEQGDPARPHAPETPRSTPTLPRRGSYQADKRELLHRFNRVCGQLQGIRDMVEAERYCPEVLIQLSSVIAALEKIGFILLRDHIRTCVAEGIRQGRDQEYLDELMTTIQRFTGR